MGAHESVPPNETSWRRPCLKVDIQSQIQGQTTGNAGDDGLCSEDQSYRQECVFYVKISSSARTRCNRVAVGVIVTLTFDLKVKGIQGQRVTRWRLNAPAKSRFFRRQNQLQHTGKVSLGDLDL